jgi:pimeloyl-ACP methyl ester carboxylesterase
VSARRWRDRFPGRRFVDVGGVDLHYERQGPVGGTPVVLVHGLGDMAATFRGAAMLLADAGFDVISLDLKGCGYSEKPDAGDWSTAALVEEVRGVLDALKIKRATVIGVSYGGHLALRLAALYPKRVAVLVACNAFAYLEPMNRPLELTLARLPGLRSIAHLLMSRRSLEKAYRRWNFSKAYDGIVERVSEHWRFLSMPGGRRSYIRLALGIDEDQVRQAEREHRSITAPTLLLWGDADAWFPLEQGRRLAREIRGSVLKVIPGGSHLFLEETPTAFTRLVIPFLKKSGAGPELTRKSARKAAKKATTGRVTSGIRAAKAARSAIVKRVRAGRS